MSNLPELLARVQAAKGADRVIDWMINWRFIQETDTPFGDDFAENVAIVDGINGVGERVNDDGQKVGAACYTSSLDACAAFAGRELPGCYWRLSNSCVATVVLNLADANEHSELGATPALAFLAAILAALIAKEGE